MKSIIFSILWIGLAALSSSAQCTYFPNPQTKAELTSTNCYLARRYAPVLFQYSNTDPDDDPTSNYRDTPTKINFDGDWNHLNNWENYKQVVWRVPYAYYHVFWTDELYIITFSYYYPRDWASTGNVFCNANTSQHEGDLERAIVYVDRMNDEIRGWSLSNHGHLETFMGSQNNCLESRLFPQGNNQFYNPGQHPIIFGSTGSHALYIRTDAAYFDFGTSSNACRPDPEFVMAMVPGSNFYYNTDFAPPFDGQNWPIQGNVPLYTNTYRLIDVFEAGPGDAGASLWEQRFSNDDDDGMMQSPLCRAGGFYPINTSCTIGFDVLSNEFVSYKEQRFFCDDHCGNLLGLDRAVAAVPWNGIGGMDILRWMNEDLTSIPCCEADPDCEELILNDDQYTYNEYLCDSYTILGDIDIVNEMDGLIQVTFEFSSMGYLFKGPVNWTITASPGLSWDCISGCSDFSNTITVVFEGAIDIQNSGFTIYAQGTSLECGSIQDDWQVPINGFISDADTKVKEDSGEERSNDLMSGLSLSTDSQLDIFPNPATDFINIYLQKNKKGEVVGFEDRNTEDFKDKNYFILNSKLEMMKSGSLSSSSEAINISALANNVYFFCIKLDDGSFVFKKFVVLRD